MTHSTTSTTAPLNSPARVITASLIGTTIEFYDFYVYATAAVLVFPQLFFLPHQIPDFSRCSYGGFPTRPALPSRAAYLP